MQNIFAVRIQMYSILKINEVGELSFITTKKSKIVDFFEYLAIIIWHIFCHKELNKNFQKGSIMEQDLKHKFLNPYAVLAAILVVFLNVLMFAK